MSGVVIATVTSVMSLIGTLVVGWFVFKASNNASERTAIAQNEANETDRFDRLNAAQERDLERVRQDRDRDRAEYERRIQNAEQVAAVAGQRAEEAVDRAEEAMRTAEQFELRLTQLIVAHRDLHDWASQPCPHPMPPPPSPTWFPAKA